MRTTILNGDALDMLRTLPSGSVQCCVTSPPYFGLRDYGVDGQIGLEASPDSYIENLVAVFREVRRVLRDDGTLWLNLGDCYAGTGKSGGGEQGKRWAEYGADTTGPKGGKWKPPPTGLKQKDRMMIPARVALALQADGWWLRDEIVWHKPRTTPFPANDRTVSAHEMVYLLAKRERYFFDWAAIEEPAAYAGHVKRAGAQTLAMVAADPVAARKRPHSDGAEYTVRDTRRSRSVWSISPQPYREAHFATMPLTLAEKCVAAGSREGDAVLDPFGGAGTTALAAKNLGRRAVIIELNPAYCALARKRLGEQTLTDVLREAAAQRHRMTEALAP